MTPISVVQASAGTALTTGSGTVSLTGCKKGNVFLTHIAERGVAEDFSSSAYTNTESIGGVSGSPNGIVSGSGISPGILHQIGIGRVVKDGTISFDMTVGASGNDIFGRIYELAQVSDSHDGNGLNTVFENGAQAQGRDVNAANGTSVNFSGSPVVANGADRYAVVMGALASNQAVADFTGETNADLTQPVAAFQSATGATCTMFIQTVQLSTKVSVDSGAFTVGVATDWVVCTFALLPRAPIRSQDLDFDYSR